jgi:uncharacterized membrane protein HdeD (DUF308 family)
MLAEELRHAYHHTRWSFVVRGLIWVALGVFIIMRPLESVAALALVIAIWALITGIVQIVQAIELRRTLPHWWLLLIGGVVSTGFGIAALYYYPGLSLTFAVIWTSYWLLVTGFFTVYASVLERRIGMPWAWTAALGLVGVLAGVYAIVSPPTTLAVIISLIAAVAIVGGVIQLIAAYRMSVARATVADALRAPATP